MKIIEGGVCAAKGFKAGSVRCGVKESRTNDDTAIIFSECECTAAATYTMNRVKAKLAEWEPRLPEGVTVSPAYDPTKFIQTTMEEMVVTILSALLLVILSPGGSCRAGGLRSSRRG